MALILLFKVMVALSVLLWYGAAVLRFVNDLFLYQFRKQLEVEYSQHPEMRNLDLDDFHNDVFLSPRDHKRVADGKSDIFVVDSPAHITLQEEEQSSLLNGNSMEGRIRSDGYDNLKKRYGNSNGNIEFRKTEGTKRGSGEKEREKTFSGFEYPDPDHYYSILRSSQSGGHGRDEKPQSGFTATTSHTKSEWVSMSISTAGQEGEAMENGDAASVAFTTTRENLQENYYRHNFNPSRDDDHNDEEYDDGETRQGGSTDHSFYYYTESSPCDGRTTTTSADLSKGHDPNILSNDDGYYCSAAADGDSKGVTNHFESGYYYDGKDLQAHHQSDDDVYTEFHKYVKEQQENLHESNSLKPEELGNHYHTDFSFASQSEAYATTANDNLMNSSSSILLSKSSASVLIILLLNRCVFEVFL